MTQALNYLSKIKEMYSVRTVRQCLTGCGRSHCGEVNIRVNVRTVPRVKRVVVVEKYMAVLEGERWPLAGGSTVASLFGSRFQAVPP